MQTVREIVREALWISGIVPLGRDEKAAELNFGVHTLNDMLSAWALDGIDLEQAELADADEPTFDAAYLKGVKYNLAVEMASGPFNVQVTQGVVSTAIDQKSLIRTALFTISDMTFDDAPITFTTNSPYY